MRIHVELLPIHVSALSKVPPQTMNICEWQKIDTYTQAYRHI